MCIDSLIPVLFTRWCHWSNLFYPTIINPPSTHMYCYVFFTGKLCDIHWTSSAGHRELGHKTTSKINNSGRVYLLSATRSWKYINSSSDSFTTTTVRDLCLICKNQGLLQQMDSGH